MLRYLVDSKQTVACSLVKPDWEEFQTVMSVFVGIGAFGLGAFTSRVNHIRQLMVAKKNNIGEVYSTLMRLPKNYEHAVLRARIADRSKTVVVRQSRLVGGGSGLFALCAIKSGSMVAKYDNIGSCVLSSTQVKEKQESGHANYIFPLDDGRGLDLTAKYDCLIRYCNTVKSTASKKHKIKDVVVDLKNKKGGVTLKNNVSLHMVGNSGVFLQATCAIQRFDELFIEIADRSHPVFKSMKYM